MVSIVGLDASQSHAGYHPGGGVGGEFLVILQVSSSSAFLFYCGNPSYGDPANR